MANLLTKFQVKSIVRVGVPDEEDCSINHQYATHVGNLNFLEAVLSNKCKKCNSLKPPASHHCSICRRCIARMDHHCPWVNNCVGYYNQKFFLLFLIYVFLGASHALLVIANKSYYCLDKNCLLFRPDYMPILTGVAAFLALLFALFVSIMFCD